MTLPAIAGVRSPSRKGTPECEASYGARTMLHKRVTRANINWGNAGEAKRTEYTERCAACLPRCLADVRRGGCSTTCQAGVVDHRARALLAVATADSRGRPLAGRGPTVLKSCVGVASQRGSVPDRGARGADPAPVWRKC